MLAHARTIALVAALGAAGSPLVAQADETGADEAYRSAAEHYSQRDWQTACDDFARMLSAAPDDARASDARFHYGEALVQLGRYQEVRQEFDTLLEHDPEHRYARQALFRSGEAALLAGDRAEARRQLQVFRQKYPDDALNAIALRTWAGSSATREIPRPPSHYCRLRSNAIRKVPWWNKAAGGWPRHCLS